MRVDTTGRSIEDALADVIGPMQDQLGLVGSCGDVMNDLLSLSALSVLVVSFGIGIVVGLTGMGGGALMTPALIFLGVNPAVAVANDLVAASVNKSVGAAVHWRVGRPNLRLAGLLMCASVPTAFAGAFIVKAGRRRRGPGGLHQGGARPRPAVHRLTYALRMYLQLRYVTGGQRHTRGGADA